MNSQEIDRLPLVMKLAFAFHLVVILGAFVASAYMAERYGETRAGTIGSIVLFLCACLFTFITTKMLERETAKHDHES